MITATFRADRFAGKGGVAQFTKSLAIARAADKIRANAVFLCSPAASFITGAVMPVDGGHLVT